MAPGSISFSVAVRMKQVPSTTYIHAQYIYPESEVVEM